jgi:hypothetical protein
MTTISLMKRPSAWLPLAMSAAALLVVLAHVGFYGTAREPDEGTAAHIWQLLMGIQMPIVAFYAITWLPRVRSRAVFVLALQCGAALAALAPVYFLNL